LEICQLNAHPNGTTRNSLPINSFHAAVHHAGDVVIDESSASLFNSSFEGRGSGRESIEIAEASTQSQPTEAAVDIRELEVVVADK
jgi:hypothetical protein